MFNFNSLNKPRQPPPPVLRKSKPLKPLVSQSKAIISLTMPDKLSSTFVYNAYYSQIQGQVLTGVIGENRLMVIPLYFQVDDTAPFINDSVGFSDSNEHNAVNDKAAAILEFNSTFSVTVNKIPCTFDSATAAVGGFLLDFTNDNLISTAQAYDEFCFKSGLSISNIGVMPKDGIYTVVITRKPGTYISFNSENSDVNNNNKKTYFSPPGDFSPPGESSPSGEVRLSRFTILSISDFGPILDLYYQPYSESDPAIDLSYFFSNMYTLKKIPAKLTPYKFFLNTTKNVYEVVARTEISFDPFLTETFINCFKLLTADVTLFINYLFKFSPFYFTYNMLHNCYNVRITPELFNLLMINANLVYNLSLRSKNLIFNNGKLNSIQKREKGRSPLPDNYDILYELSGLNAFTGINVNDTAVSARLGKLIADNSVSYENLELLSGIDNNITGGIGPDNITAIINGINSIAANTLGIDGDTDNLALIAESTSNTAINTFNTATNTFNTALNTSNIALNTSNIALNTSNIALNTFNIAENTSNTAISTSAIALSTAAINLDTDNLEAIANNTSNIALNTSNTAEYTFNIAENTSNTAISTSAIALSTAAINLDTDNLAQITLNTSNTATNTFNTAEYTFNIAENTSNTAT
jgi:hypothetical protein